MKRILKKILIKILITEAKLVLKKYKPKIVAITGSVGKTSTKDAVFTALQPFYFVRKSLKSFNSDIGIPLTILGVPNGWNNAFVWFKNVLRGLELILFKEDYPKWLVLEIGADRPGEIEAVCKWIKPDISVITRISDVPVHVEFYDSVEEVVKEKSNLAKAVKKEGALILNADDEDVLSFAKQSKAKVFTYSLGGEAEVVGTYPQIVYEDEKPKGMSVKIDVGGNSLPVSIHGAIGTQHLYPLLAAFAAAHSQCLNLIKVSQAFTHHDTPLGRMKIVDGIKDSTIIDDTYNASPIALEEGLHILKEIQCKGKKIVMIGDMLELGRYSVSEHKRLGFLAAEVADKIITVGIRAKDYAVGAIENKFDKKKIYSFDDSVSAGKFAKTILKSNDCIFAKGSQGIRMEKAVAEILANPDEKEKLLVRQEEEWRKR